MVRAGKVLYVGVSDTPAWIVPQANTLADAARLVAASSALQIDVQPVRAHRRARASAHGRALDLAVTTWGALGSGVLTGKYDMSGARRMATPPADLGPTASPTGPRHRGAAQGGRRGVERSPRAGGARMDAGANRADRSRSSARAPWISCDNLRAAEVHLPDDAVKRLDEVSAIELTFPQRFLQADDMRRSVHGDTFGLVEDHRGRLPL